MIHVLESIEIRHHERGATRLTFDQAGDIEIIAVAPEPEEFTVRGFGRG